MSLSNLGWNPFFARHFEELETPDIEPARIFRQEKDRYVVHAASGSAPAVMTGTLRRALADRQVSLTVGDWVAVTSRSGTDDRMIHHMLPRRSAFSRKQAGMTTREQVMAANIDTVFLVSGLDGDFNLRRIERYVTQAWNSGAMPVILLNKADVCDDLDGRLVATQAIAPGVDVHAMSATQGTGLDRLRSYIKTGTTVAFLGSSGVGKSTLFNRLLGSDYMRTEDVREDDSRGRHTTTHREMLHLPGGGLVIDTPGMRELQLWSTDEDLAQTFSDVALLAEGCRFRDCSHTSEPGCAVMDALEAGTLDNSRYQSYQKLEKEVEYLERRQDEASSYLRRQHNKKLTKMYNRIAREKGLKR